MNGLTDWIVTHCSVAGCGVAIRYRAGQLGHPDCKWHQTGTAHVRDQNPPGCPDPDLPWPWKTEREREEQARKLYWQDKFKQDPVRHARWIIQPEPVCVPDEPVATGTGNQR